MAGTMAAMTVAPNPATSPLAAESELKDTSVTLTTK